MATETGIPKSVCLKKDEKEDIALSSEILEEKVTELPVNKVKQLESGPNQPLETSSQVAETVYTQLETSKPTNESGTFFEALSVSMVTSNTPESCKATITEDRDKRKTTETETLYERKPNDDGRVEAVSTQTEPQEENIQSEVKYYDEATIEKEASEETVESEVGLKLSDSKLSSEKEVLEKDQGNNDDVTSSQDATCEDIKEMTTSQNATIVADFKEQDLSEKPSDFLKEETADTIHDAKEASELCENGAEDNSEQKPKECIKQIEQEEEIEEIRPSVGIEENIEQNGLLHDITADACISTHTKSQVETTEHEEKDEEEAEKSDSPLIKEVNKEIGPEKAVYHETEQEDNMQEKEQGENDVTSVQDLTFEGRLEETNQNSEGNECEIVKAKQNIDEDAEENRSSIETPEEMEQEILINVVPVDVCISTKTEPEEETTENNIEKNDEAIERDDGQVKKSGSLMVEKILEQNVSEKAESEEGLKLPESDQEKKHELNVSEKGQGGGDEIKCSQNATSNDIKETNAVISEEIPKEKAVDRSIDAQEARELCENGAKDNIEQTPKESVTEIEEIRPGVEKEEKVEQNGLLHDIKADACISTQTKSEVETTEREENDEEEAEKSESPLIKEVSEETGLEKAEYQKVEQEVSVLKKDGDDEKEQEVNTLEEDTEKIRSSIETPEEMEHQPLINVIPTDICVSTKTEPDEETTESIEKNDEEAIENDDGQTNKSGSLVVEKIHEDVVSEKAESEEGLKLPESSNEIVSKDEDQEEEQELNVSDKGQGSGDEITSSQNASSDDLKETNFVISEENLKEEAVDRSIDAQEVCAQYEDVTKDNREQKPDESVNRTVESSSTDKQEEYTEEIKPSVEPNEEKSVCISTKTESQEEATKDEQKEIESDGDQKEKSDNSLVKEVCDDNDSKEILLEEEKNEKKILILRKDEDQEKEQELDMSEKDQDKDKVTCSQDTTAVSEEDLQENEGTEPEVVDTKESIKEGIKEVRSSDETPEKIEQPTDVCISTHTEIEEKNDEEAFGEICAETILEKAEPEEGLKPSDENEIVSIDEDQEKEQKHSLSKKSQGGEDGVTSSQNASDKDTIETMIGQHVTTEAYFEEGQGLSAMPKEIFKEEADDKSIEAQETSEQYEDGALDKEQKPEESVDKFQQSCSIVEQEEYTEEIKPNFDANEEKEEEAKKNEENDIENDSDKKENSNNSVVKEVSEETELKNTEIEENVNISASSNINLDEKTVAILSKDDDKGKEQELKDATAVSEEDLQEKNYSGKSDEREFVETRESIQKDIEKNDEDQQEDNYHNKGNEPVVVDTKENEVEDTEEIKSSVETNKTTETKPEEETTEKIVEEATEYHDDQTKKSEILLVEEVCEATSLEKAESEEGLKHSDSFSTTLDKDDKVNKEVDVEKDRDLKTSNFIGGENDVISSQNVANEDIKETEIGEHATTEAYFEEGNRVSATIEEIIEEEAEDRSIDGQEASENCQKAKESNQSSVNSGSEVTEGDIKEDEADARNNKEIKAMLDTKIQDDMTEDKSVTKKMSTELEQPKEQIVEEIQASQTEIVSEKKEEEITKNDEDLSCDKIEDTNGSTTTEEKIFSDGRENESVEERTCNLDEVLEEKIIDENETTAVEPQEDNTPSNSLRTSTNNTSNSEKAKAESENLSIDNLESVSEVQIPEVVPTSEELKFNEECLISATTLQVDEEIGTVKEDILTDKKTEQATEIKQETFEEACEETSSEKAELEEGIKSSDSSNMEINEKAMTTFKDDDQEKDQEVDILIKGQGKDDVTSSRDAAFKEEDLQEKRYESEDGFVKTGENVDEDTKIINSTVETKESESGSSLFKEACDATSSEKAESEDVVEHSESSGAKLDENEIVSKEENQEKEPIDAQEASDQCENGENEKSGQHDEESVNVPVKSCAENVEGNITEDEAGAGEEKEVEAKLDAENQVDRTDDTSEIKDEVISTENISRETIAVEPQEDIKPSSSLGKSTEDISDSVKLKAESDNLQIEDHESVSEVQVPKVVPKSEDSEIATYVDEEKGTATTEISSSEQPEKSHITTEENVTRLQPIGENDSSYEERDLEEDVTQESQLDSTEDCSDIVNDVIFTDEVSLEIQKEKEINDFKEQITGEASYSQNEKEMAHEISYSDPISVGNPELTEDLQAAEDISCQSKVKNDSVDEASKEKSISSLEDAATSEPQVYLSNIESTAYPSESEKLPTQALESVCDVQTTEVLVDSEESKVKEESIVLETVEYTDETKIEDELKNKSNEILSSADTEEENVKQAPKKSEEAKRSDLNKDETVLTKENCELHGELEITSESMTEEDRFNETTPQPEQPDITSESIIYDQTLESKLGYTNEKDLDVKRDIEEDVTLAPENQIKGVDETTKTVILTDEVEVETEKDNESNEVKEQISEEDNSTTEQLDNASTPNQNELANEIVLSKLVPGENTEVTELQAEREIEPENMQVAEDISCVSDASSTIIGEVKDRSVEEALNDDVIPVQEDFKASELQVSIPETELIDTPANGQDSMKLTEGISCSTQEIIEEKSVLISQLTDKESLEEKDDKLISEVQTPEEHQEVTNDTYDSTLTSGVSSEKLSDETEENDAKEDIEVRGEVTEKVTEESCDDAVAKVMVHERLEQTEKKLVSMVPPEELTPPMDKEKTHELVLETDKASVEHNSLANKDQYPELVKEEFTKTISEEQSIKERYFEDEGLSNFGIENKETSRNNEAEDVIVNEVLLEDETAKESKSIKDDINEEIVCNQLTSATDEVSQIERSSSISNELLETKDPVEDIEDPKLMVENLKLKGETFTVMKEPNEESEILAPEVGSFENLVTEEKIIKTDESREKETLDEPHADDLPKATSDSISSFTEQDMVVKSESRGHGDLSKLEGKPNEVLEVTTEVVEIVAEGQEASTILTDNFQEASSKMHPAKHEPEITTTTEELEDKIKDKEVVCLPVEKTETLQVSTLIYEIGRDENSSRDMLNNKNEALQPQEERVSKLEVVDPPTDIQPPHLDTKQALLEFVDQESQREQKKEADENIEAAIPIEDVKSLTREPEVKSVNLEGPSVIDAAADKAGYNEDPNNMTDDTYEAVKGVVKDDQPLESTCDTVMKQEPLDVNAPATLDTAAMEDLNISQNYVIDDLIKNSQTQPEIPKYEVSTRSVDKQSPNEPLENESKLLTENIDASQEHEEPTAKSLIAEVEEKKVTQASTTEPQYSSEVLKEGKKTSDEKENSESAEKTKVLFSDILHERRKETSEVPENLIGDKQTLQTKDQQVGKEENGECEVKTDEESEGEVIVEASKDMEEVKVPKKSHNILSGVGSKVKHSLAKVKKAITGKSSHPKPPTP